VQIGAIIPLTALSGWQARRGTFTGCANHPDLAELTTPVKFFLFGGGR
jgi:hypothetical protein